MEPDQNFDPVQEVEDEARARMLAEKHGIDFDAPLPYRHPFLNNDSRD